MALVDGQYGLGAGVDGVPNRLKVHRFFSFTMISADNTVDPLIPTPTPLRTLILPPLLLSLLSPVLGTLTSATTSDSIWPLAGGLGFVHLLLVDFRTGEDVRVARRRERLRKRRGSVGLREIGEEKRYTSRCSRPER